MKDDISYFCHPYKALTSQRRALYLNCTKISMTTENTMRMKPLRLPEDRQSKINIYMNELTHVALLNHSSSPSIPVLTHTG